VPRTLVRDRRFRRFAIFLALVALTGAAGFVRAASDLPLTPEAVREMIGGWGHLGPLVFTGAFALRPFVFFPSTLLFLAGGLAFGVGWGTMYAAVGGTLGAVLGFTIARLLGHDFVRAQLGDRVSVVKTDRWGAGVVLVLNLIPVVPMTMINYGAGLSGMALLPFVVAVVCGITPRAFAYSFFGNSLLDIGSAQFIAGLALLAALVVIPLLVRHRLSKRVAATG
jgi:uncharacterized membrane protein YdjX (TVP38/TMEM64 family)